jgi:hypothetical protein
MQSDYLSHQFFSSFFLLNSDNKNYLNIGPVNCEVAVPIIIHGQ